MKRKRSDDIYTIFAENVGKYELLSESEEKKLFKEYSELKHNLIREVFKDVTVSKEWYYDIVNRRFYDIFHYDVSYFKNQDTRHAFVEVIENIKNTVLKYVSNEIDYETYVNLLDELSFIKLSYLIKLLNKVNFDSLILPKLLNIRDKIFNSNVRLVVYLVKKNIKNSSYMMDVIQEGSLGLLNAIDRYDISKNQRFSTYATQWIYCYIRAYSKTTDIIRIPDSIRKVYKRIFELLSEDKNITVEELAAFTGFSKDDIEKALESFIILNIDNLERELTLDEERNDEETINFIGEINNFLLTQEPLVKNVIGNLLKYENVLSRIEIAQMENVSERRYLNLLIFVVSKLLHYGDNVN